MKTENKAQMLRTMAKKMSSKAANKKGITRDDSNIKPTFNREGTHGLSPKYDTSEIPSRTFKAIMPTAAGNTGSNAGGNVAPHSKDYTPMLKKSISVSNAGKEKGAPTFGSKVFGSPKAGSKNVGKA